MERRLPPPRPGRGNRRACGGLPVSRGRRGTASQPQGTSTSSGGERNASRRRYLLPPLVPADGRLGEEVRDLDLRVLRAVRHMDRVLLDVGGEVLAERP